MSNGLYMLFGLIWSSTLSSVYLMTREGLKTTKRSTAAMVTIIIPVGIFLLFAVLDSLARFLMLG